MLSSVSAHRRHSINSVTSDILDVEGLKILPDQSPDEAELRRLLTVGRGTALDRVLEDLRKAKAGMGFICISFIKINAIGLTTNDHWFRVGGHSKASVTKSLGE